MGKPQTSQEQDGHEGPPAVERVAREADVEEEEDDVDHHDAVAHRGPEAVEGVRVEGGSP